MIRLKTDVRRLLKHKDKLIKDSLFLLFCYLLVLSFGEAIAHNTAQQESNGSVTHHKVLVRNFAFEPENLTVRKGDTVSWTNKDFAPHNITRKQPDESTTKLSANMSLGEKFTMTINGGFDYLCGLHPSMTGKILIQQ